MESNDDRNDAKRRRELNPHRTLLESLFHELFQTERSAELHSPEEAARLGDTPPARALRAVAHHAISVNSELPSIAGSRNLPRGKVGSVVGDAFSLARRLLSDPMMEAERSYRATLLGMRHGVDLVRLVRATADAGGDADLVSWCSEWLAVREPLVEEVAGQLEWFAWHPDPATRHLGGWRSMWQRLFRGSDHRHPQLSST